MRAAGYGQKKKQKASNLKSSPLNFSRCDQNFKKVSYSTQINKGWKKFHQILSLFRPDERRFAVFSIAVSSDGREVLGG